MAEKITKHENVLRPPIVVVMGHIDHGKTSILDVIRKTHVAEKEAGGITQHIGAYLAEHKGKKITFIDTPGHEAFAAMRGRGAHVADAAVLVVAADEGVKPQTEEAIRIINEAELPLVVAINKVDAPNSDPARVKRELAERSLLVEGLGGTVPVVELSAKTGQGIDSLLETILLLAELEELKSDPTKAGQGVIIESHIDPKRGATATLLIDDGTVARGDFIAIGDQVSPVRIFENFRGEAIESAKASEPIRIIGFSSAPQLGETFRVFKSRPEAEDWAEAQKAQPSQLSKGKLGGQGESAPGEAHIVNIVLKADVRGSLEALEATIKNIGSSELQNRIIKAEVGDINESDVKAASATPHTLLIGFKVKLPPAVKELAERNGVAMARGEVIYELLDAVKTAMLASAPAELKRVDLGRAKILALFREKQNKQIVGGRVESGAIRAGARFDAVRNGVKIGSGRVIELQSGRRPAEEVPEGQEFGILAEADISIAVGDTLEIFSDEKVTPRL